MKKFKIRFFDNIDELLVEAEPEEFNNYAHAHCEDKINFIIIGKDKFPEVDVIDFEISGSERCQTRCKKMKNAWVHSNACVYACKKHIYGNMNKKFVICRK